MIPVRTTLLPFRTLEIVQAVLERPTGRDSLSRVEVLLLSAHADEPVDRRRPAKASFAQPVESAVAQVRFRLSPKPPVEAGGADGL